MRLKDYLKNKLTKKELGIFPTSFDIVGDIAIFSDFPGELVEKEKLIGNSLMNLNRNIKVVCKKVRKYSGKYRTSKLKIIAGEKRKETMYVENGSRFLLDVEKVYFSPRLGNERKRIADLVKKNENVLVMFSGIGPYTIQIAKKARKVTAIEANPIAHEYAMINLKLNKIKNASVLKGDVRKVIPELKEKFDRIIMPLPKSAENFLKYAFLVSKKGTVVHFYTFAREDKFENIKKRLANNCKGLKKNIKILKIVKTGEYAPHIQRICVDFGILLCPKSR